MPFLTGCLTGCLLPPLPHPKACLLVHGGRGLGHVKVDVEVRCTFPEALLSAFAWDFRDVRVASQRINFCGLA